MLPPSVSACQSCSLTMRTALSMSQSLKMMRGDFPPSSRETFFRLLRAQLQQGITRGGGGRAWSWFTRLLCELMSNEFVRSYLFMICLPIGVEPVKPSLRMSGWSDKRCPTMPPAGEKGIRKVDYGSIGKLSKWTEKWQPSTCFTDKHSSVRYQRWAV